MSFRSKSCALILTVFVLIISLWGFFLGAKQAVDHRDNPFKELSREWRREGGGAGNIANAGMVGHNGHIIAFSASKGLTILNLEGEEPKIIETTVGRVWDINVTEAGLFFINLSDGSSIYRMDLAGSSMQKVKDTHSRNLYVAGEHIYFTDNWDRNHLYRMDLEGNNAERVMHNPAIWAVIQGEWVYYAHDMEGWSLYAYNLETGEDLRLTDYGVWRIHPHDEWVYYVKGVEEGPIYRTRKDGSEENLVLDVRTKMFLIKDDRIYYSEQDLNPGFYRYTLGEKAPEKIAALAPDLLYELGPYIILMNMDDAGVRKYHSETGEMGNW